MADCISLAACLLVTAVRRIVSIDISLPRLYAVSSFSDAAITYENQQLQSNCSLLTRAEQYSPQKSQKRPYRALNVSVEEVALELLPRGKRARVCDDNTEFGPATEAPDLHYPVQVTVENFDENPEIISSAFEADNNFHPFQDDVLDSFLHLKGAGSHPGMSARLSRRDRCLVTLHQTIVDSILAFSCIGQAPLIALQSCGIISSNIDMDSISVQYCERILKQIDSESQISVVGQSTDLNFHRLVMKHISLLHLLLLLKDLLSSCGIRVAYEFWQVALEHWNLKSILGSELDPKTEVGKIREILDKLHSFVEQKLFSDHPKFEKLVDVLNSNEGAVIVVARHHSMVEAVIQNVSGLHPIFRLQDHRGSDKPINALCLHEAHISEVPPSIWQSAKCIVFLESLSDDEIDSLPVCSSETCIIELVTSCESMNTKSFDQNLDLYVVVNCKSILIQEFVRFGSENHVSVIIRDLQFEDVVIDGQHSAVILDLEAMSEGSSGFFQFSHQLNVMLLRYRYIHCIVDFTSHSFKSVSGKGFQEFNSLLNSFIQNRPIQLIFCENRSEICQSIFKIAIKSNASSLAIGSHFEMQETMLEQWLTGFPSINPVLAQQIISVAPIRNFMEMNLSEKVTLVQSSRVLETFHELVEKDFGKVHYQRPSRVDYAERSISPSFQDETIGFESCPEAQFPCAQTMHPAEIAQKSLPTWNSNNVPPPAQFISSKRGPHRASVESLAKSFFANLTSSVNAPLNSVAPSALQLPPPVAPSPAPTFAVRNDVPLMTGQARQQNSATRHDISVRPNTPVWHHDVSIAGSAEVDEFAEFLKWKQMQQAVPALPPAPRSGLPTRPDAAISRPFVPSFESRRESTLDRGFAASSHSKRMRSEVDEDYGLASGRQPVAPATVTPGALSFLDSFKLQRNAAPIPQATLRDPRSNIDLRSPFARNNRHR
jgi:hypothetical protein